MFHFKTEFLEHKKKISLFKQNCETILFLFFWNDLLLEFRLTGVKQEERLKDQLPRNRNTKLEQS
jgi:hypothetical protein